MDKNFSDLLDVAGEWAKTKVSEEKLQEENEKLKEKIICLESDACNEVSQAQFDDAMEDKDIEIKKLKEIIIGLGPQGSYLISAEAEVKKLQEENEELKEEIFTQHAEYGTFTDIKKIDVLRKQYMDFYNCLDQDDLKGLGLMNGEPLEHRDYIFYLQDKLAGKWE